MGRRSTSVEIGYVFIFFYGLERRLLVDLAGGGGGQDEVAILRDEIARLLSLHGSRSGSFNGYASGLLQYVDLIHGRVDVGGYSPLTEERQWECPLPLKVGLAKLVADGQPIPWDWALGWYLSSPKIQPSLRTPATRCKEEFRKLFAIRYAERYGPGMAVKPNKTQLTASYRTASAALGEFATDCSGLSDVTALNAPLKKVDELVQSCTDELDAYSRYLGRNDNARGSLLAISELPGDLIQLDHGEALVALRDWLDRVFSGRDIALLAFRDLIDSVLTDQAEDGQTSRKDAERLTCLLAKCGIGIEPDVRYGGGRPDTHERLVLFRMPPDNENAEPSDNYRVAELVVHLFFLIAASDGAISADENAYLRDYFRQQTDLSSGEQARLRAFSRWLSATRPGTKGLKKRIKTLSDDQARLLGQFLVGVAGVESGVSPAEVDALRRAYQLIGLQDEQLHADIHAFATATAPDDPVSIRPATSGTGATPIPRVPNRRPQLDPELVTKRTRETEQVARLLDDIFSEAEEELMPVQAEPEEEDLEGLDGAHSSLVRELVGRSSINREEWEALVGVCALLPDGALDVINEWALDGCDECLIEGDEDLLINQDVLEEMLR